MKKLTEGPLVKLIFQFILPIMAMNLLQNLYNAADMVVVGYSGVPGALGAIGTTSAMNNFFLNIFIGFSVGANVVIARHLGARELDRASKAVHTSLLTALLFGFLGGLVGFFLIEVAYLGLDGWLQQAFPGVGDGFLHQFRRGVVVF